MTSRRVILSLVGVIFGLLLITLLAPEETVLKPDAVTVAFIGQPADYNRFVITNRETHPIYVDTIIVQSRRPVGWYDDFAEVVTSLGAVSAEWETIGRHITQLGVVEPGASRHFYIDWPRDRGWRLCLSYWRPLSGGALWKAKLREAWGLRSFSAWRVKKWGFRSEIVSEEYQSSNSGRF